MRSLLHIMRQEVRGSVNSGYYAADIQIGTPPQVRLPVWVDEA